MNASKMTDITALNSLQSPLLNLPAELRNMIYEHLPSGYIILIEAECGSTTFQSHLIAKVNARIQNPQFQEYIELPTSFVFAFRLVCRQITSETNPLKDLLYSQNVFGFTETFAIDLFMDAVADTKTALISELYVPSVEVFNNDWWPPTEFSEQAVFSYLHRKLPPRKSTWSQISGMVITMRKTCPSRCAGFSLHSYIIASSTVFLDALPIRFREQWMMTGMPYDTNVWTYSVTGLTEPVAQEGVKSVCNNCKDSYECLEHPSPSPSKVGQEKSS
ncbi:hypothetical protein K491DRAFT_712275 [Lophiostoma macrostomum CBS 122681]|uniref:DUF7730 domain-containing protein n=1 Tax=Lophiostoma macrostomum CBS 122681 TaxID=1314788 RepID=A0A6A6TI89_9PLEO|nr:hypothetical protein K491DRAFT_712275 [Lophiostoma macrostomum CBS 122681]